MRVISQATNRPKGVLYTVATLSLLAALIHLWVMSERFEEWWGYGMLQRMVDEEAYCVNILTQIASIVSASEKVALLLHYDHVEHCVREAIEDEEMADEKAPELAIAVERFLRV